jgi:5-methyltetrahydropteroyltriglutamate--homocysteine methyltransferase
MATPYRADHLGSFLRPAELLKARADFHVPRDQVKALEDRTVLNLLQKQKDLGFAIFTDGEVRRDTFMSDFNDAVEGMSDEATVHRNWQGASQGVATPLGVVTGKIKAKGRMTAHELAFLKQHGPGDIKMTLPTANQFPAISYKKGITDKVYATPSNLLWDIVPVIRDEITALVDEGVKYVQIDAPRYSYYCDPKWRDFIKNEMGMDPDAALDEAIRADNACLEGARRPGVILSIHLCRGNNRSQWYAQGGYDAIAEKMFNTLKVDRYLLEYEDERSGTFEPLRLMPRDKQVVLGIISSKVAALESQAEMVKRVEEAAKFFPLDQLAVSPQCGFASTAPGNLLTEDEQWAKMKLVAGVAKQVWGVTS